MKTIVILIANYKKTISELCGNDVAPAFIEYHEDEKELMDTYLTARVRR